MMGTLTRRSFHRRTLGGMSLAAGLGPLAGRRGLASPTERVAVALIGAGGRAQGLLNLFCDQPDVDLVAVADVDQQRLESASEDVVARRGRRPARHQDFRHVLDDPNIDAVIIATPDHWHAIPAILACQAGKDVYVEKPDGHNMLEGQRIVQAMRKHERIVQLGTQARSSEHMRAAIDFVGSGKLGRVLVAKAWESARQGSIGRPPDGQPPAHIDYDMWLGPAPQRPFNPRRFHGSWRWFFDYGTGDLGNDGVHRIDVARWALATAVRIETQQTMSPLPASISAAGGKWYFDDLQDWPDTLHVTYRYDVPQSSGRLLIYEMKIWTPYPHLEEHEGVVLYGDQAYLVIGNTRWRAYAPDGEVLAEGQGSNEGEAHVRDFVDCVRSRRRPAADLETIGHPSSIMCHAGNVAWRLGKQLSLDPETENFDDADANQLRTRPEYRAPWNLPNV